MIDKFIYLICGWIDKRSEFLNKIVDDVYTFDFPNCKKKTKNVKSPDNRMNFPLD
jgi:hypothetical protein